MINLETIVSRKTPIDGRLEIPESLAARLAESYEPIRVRISGEEEGVVLEEMPCTCAKAGGNHVHHFLVGEQLKTLPAGASARLTVDVDEGVIDIEL